MKDNRERIFPDYEGFNELAKKGNVIPVYMKMLADVETPISAYLKISEGSDYSYLLESVEGENRFSRYTFLGANPFLKIKAQKNKVIIEKNGNINEVEIEEGKDPLSYLKEIMNQYTPVKIEGLPNFTGGAVGYSGYDIVRYFEKIGDKKPDILNVPDMFYMLTDTIIAFDRFKQELIIICNVMTEEEESNEKAYNSGIEKIKKIYNKLMNEKPDYTMDRPEKMPEIKSNFKVEEFCSAVETAKEHIKAGDIFQVVLSQRFYAEYDSNTFSFYRRLRSINPSPYMFYINCKEFTIAGASPEILVKLENETITLRPIAGTRKRGKNIEEDIALEKELLADEKEVAEHVMLVDLGRNDVGRVAEYGSVRVAEQMVIEKYSHVMHIVSSVQGKIQKGKDGYDLIRAVFPAGTLSGAPKIKAMEIIENLEPEKRGVYGGSVGYFSFNGDLDSCITIRTVLFKDGIAYMQAGAGIVYDSVPMNEFRETENKIAAVMSALK